MRKVTDTSRSVSAGGRAAKYWEGKRIKKNGKYVIEKVPSPQDDAGVISKKYNLKGFEWGNWVSNAERVEHLTAISQSLRDLSKIVGTKNLGFNKKLGIALGARGVNGSAKAHFEPDYWMINLTKTKGVGSLAHEYGHALDYFFGLFVDQNKFYSSLTGGSSTAKTLPDNKGGKLRTLANKVVDVIIWDKNQESESYSRLIHSTQGNAYWKRRNELFARAFEQWIRHKLNKRGIKNSYLAKSKYSNSVYLTEKDFARVSPLMDSLTKEMAKMMRG